MMNWFSRLYGKTEQAAPGCARSEKLTCAGCGTEYFLGTSGQMVTTRVAMAKMAADGMVIMGSGPPAKLQDTLYSAGPSDWNQASRQMHDQSMTEIRESLAGGQHRTWMCRSCGHDQDYPPNL